MPLTRPPTPAQPDASAPAAVTVRAGDPRLRLFRHVIGERAHQAPELVYRLAVRDEWQDPAPVVPDRERAVRSGEVRMTGKRVEPAPNAPQLIRLVRTPFHLDPVRPVRDPDKGVPDRIKVAELSREPFSKGRIDALEESRRVPFPNATDSHPPLPVRERPSADAWLQAAGKRRAR